MQPQPKTTAENGAKKQKPQSSLIFVLLAALCLLALSLLLRNSRSRQQSNKTATKDALKLLAATDSVGESAASTTKAESPPPLVPGSNGEKWIKMAEAACIPQFSYKVTVTTVNTNEPSSADFSHSTNKTSMHYSRDRGLRLLQRSAAVSFSVDVASMIKEAGPAAPWRILKVMPDEVEIGSTNGRIALRLWVKGRDGAISKFEQDTDGKLLASSTLSYVNFQGSLLPKETSTYFPATGTFYVQRYTDYELSLSP